MTDHPHAADTELVVLSRRWGDYSYQTGREAFGATSDRRVVQIRRDEAPHWPRRGDPVPGRTLENWAAALESGHPIDTLEALPWLHYEPESSPARRDPRVIQAVRRCASSEDRWIVSAADLLLGQLRLRQAG